MRPPTPSTSATRCRPAPPCSRPAPAPARPGPSGRWSPATSPRACAGSSRCWWSPSAGPPARSSASASAASSSRPSAPCRPRRSCRRSRPTLIDLLVDCDDQERALRHRRVTEALAGFDGATIATTHQFCSMVLGSLGVAGDTDARARLVEDLDQLLGEVVDDLYLRAFAFAEADPTFTFAEAMSIARTAVGDPQARLEPAAEERTTPAGRRVAFAEAVRAEMEKRKRRLGILSYDDLLGQLADALQHPDAPARARMRQRWRIVLVDEFQDTDPVQWEVLDRAFTGHATMVLIGDPKQAIYAFRGGDVTTYLEAAATATTTKTLPVNWRSDEALLSAFQTVLAGAELGDPRIVVHDVEAHHQGSRLAGAPRSAPFRLRVLRRDQFGRRGEKPLLVSQTRPHIARDLALDVRALLASGATFDGRAARAARRRRHLLPPLRPRRGPAGAARGRRPRRHRGRRQRLRHPRGRRVGRAAGGARAAAPQPAGPHRRPHLLLRPHRPRARRAGRRPDRRGRRHPAVLGRGVRPARHRRRARGRQRRRAVRPGPRRGGRRASAHRPAPHRGGPARGRAHRAARPGRDARLAPRPGRRGTRRPRHRTHPTPRLRRGGGAARDHPREQGPRVPRRLPARAGRPQRAEAVHPAVPRRRRPALRRRRRPGGAGWGDHVQRWLDEEAGEWLRLLYVAITRAQSQVVCWWAPDPQHPGLPAAADAARAPTGAGDGARRVREPHRRRGGRVPRPLAGRRGPEPRARRARRPGRRPAAARPAGPRRPQLHPRRSTPPGAAPPTPR